MARRDGQDFDCATWLHKAREMPKEQFRREVEKELTGKETEPSELIYFKVYKSQIPGHRAGDRNSGPDAGLRQIARLLPGDDLCGFSGRGQPGQPKSGDLAVFDDEILQIPAEEQQRTFLGDLAETRNALGSARNRAIAA